MRANKFNKMKFYEYCQEGKISEVTHILDNHHVKSSTIKEAINYACQSKKIEMLKLLHKHINYEKIKLMSNSIYYLVENNNINIAKYIIDNSINVKQIKKIFLIACRCKSIDIINLIDYDIISEISKKKILFNICMTKNLDFIKYVVEYVGIQHKNAYGKKRCIEKEKYFFFDNDDSYPKLYERPSFYDEVLTKCIHHDKKNNMMIYHYFVNNFKYIPSYIDSDSYEYYDYPIGCAAMRDDIELFKLILSQSKNIDNEKMFNKCLEYSSTSSTINIFKYIIKCHKKFLNRETINGIFNGLCDSGKIGEIKFLLNNFSYIDINYIELNSHHIYFHFLNSSYPFINACTSGNFDLIIYLLNKFPKIDVINNDPHFVISSCCESGNVELFQYMIKYLGIGDDIKYQKLFEKSCVVLNYDMAYYIRSIYNININNEIYNKIVCEMNTYAYDSGDEIMNKTILWLENGCPLINIKSARTAI